MPTLSNAGTYNKKVLQPVGIDFNKRPQYTRAKLSCCTRANHFESRSQTEKTNSPGLQTCNQFSIFYTYVLYVCRHGQGGIVFSVGTWLEVACSGAAWQFCPCILWPLLNLPTGCRTLTHIQQTAD